MAQAISNKVLVQSSKYCWMICDYSMSGSTLSYNLSFYYEGGCAQLDNAWIKVGGTTVWQNAGRVHNYDGNPYQSPHTVQIHSGTATVTGSQTVSFGITKYNGVAVSGSFSVTGNTAPSGLDITITSIQDTSATFAVTLNSYGTPSSTSGRYIEAAILGSTSYGNPYKYNTASNTRSATITVTNSNNGALTITPNTLYRYGAFADNTALSTSMVKGTFTTLPAYITALYASEAGGNNVDIVVAHGAEGSAASVTTEYSYDQTNWTTASDHFQITLTSPKVIYVRRRSSAGVTPVFSMSLSPYSHPRLYGSVNGSAEELVTLYGAVATVSNVSTSDTLPKRCFDAFTPSTFEDKANSTLTSYFTSGYEVTGMTIYRDTLTGTIWGARVNLSDGDNTASYSIITDATSTDLGTAVADWGVTFSVPTPWSMFSSTMSISGDYTFLSRKLIKFYGSANGVSKLIFEDSGNA